MRVVVRQGFYCTSCLPEGEKAEYKWAYTFLGVRVRLVSCHSAVRLLLLLSTNATVSIFVLLYLITKLFCPTLLLHSGHFPPYTIIPTYTTIWNVRVVDEISESKL